VMTSFGYNVLGFGVSSSGVNWSTYDSTNDKSVVEFHGSAVRNLNVVPIDSTRALFVYRGASFYCYARIATVDAQGIITFGTETTLISANVADNKVVLLDSTHAIVAHESLGDTKALTIEFSGTTIDTIGSAVSFETVNSGHMAVAALSPSAFLIAYKRITAAVGVVYYGTVSGTTTTAKNGVTFETLNINDINMADLTSTTAIIVAGHDQVDDCEAYLISVSSDTPQVDDNLSIVSEIAPYTVDSIGIHKISSTKIITCFAEVSVDINTQAVIVTESGGTLSAGTIVEVNADPAREVSIALPDPQHAVISMGILATGLDTTVVEIDGTTLTPLTAYENISGDKEFVTNGHVGTDFVVIAYEDDDDASKGKAIVATP